MPVFVPEVHDGHQLSLASRDQGRVAFLLLAGGSASAGSEYQSASWHIPLPHHTPCPPQAGASRISARFSPVCRSVLQCLSP